MKIVLILLAVISLSFNSHAQSIIGKWGVNILVLSSETKEYNLFLTDPERFHYGNNIEFKADGTFVSYYTAPCGNDCFTTSTGRYEFINETHIRFFLEKITRIGECSGNSEPNQSLGLYAIIYEKDKIRLIKRNQMILNKN